MKLLKENKMKNNNLNTELKEMGVFSAVAGNQLPNHTTRSIAKKSPTGSLPPAVPLAITPTFSPWTHTSDDSYIYQLSLVSATATVSFYCIRDEGTRYTEGKTNILYLGKRSNNRQTTCLRRSTGITCLHLLHFISSVGPPLPLHLLLAILSHSPSSRCLPSSLPDVPSILHRCG